MTGGFVVGGAVIGEVTGDGVVTDGSVTGASVAGTVSSVGADDTLSAVDGSESVPAVVAPLSPAASTGSVSGSVTSSEISADASRTADVSGVPPSAPSRVPPHAVKTNTMDRAMMQNTSLFISIYPRFRKFIVAWAPTLYLCFAQKSNPLE